MVLENALCKRIPLLTDVPTIVFGADVTHPSPGEDVSPSIAAVCRFVLSCSTCHNLSMLQSLYLEQK
jgi:eukaryotic translation initiation factor 2C